MNEVITETQAPSSQAEDIETQVPSSQAEDIETQAPSSQAEDIETQAPSSQAEDIETQVPSSQAEDEEKTISEDNIVSEQTQYIEKEELTNAYDATSYETINKKYKDDISNFVKSKISIVFRTVVLISIIIFFYGLLILVS